MTSLLLRAPCPLTERTNTEVMRAASVAARVPLAAPRATRGTRASPTRTHTTSRSVSEGMEPALFVGADRAAKYGGNHAQYLLDLDANTATTFNFCGGMMFGVSLSPRLKEHLAAVAAGGDEDLRQPVVYDKNVRRMSQRPEGHDLNAFADNAVLFHGREVRSARDAAGGGGMLIHLSFAGGEKGEDVEGWTREETDEYAGWLSDRQRRWRQGAILKSEGFSTFADRFGQDAFCLHHRFYLHVDAKDNFWIAAEDGCEGVAMPPKPKPPAKDFGEGAFVFQQVHRVKRPS